MDKSPTGPHGVQPRALRELADGLARPRQKGAVPEDWKQATTTWADEQCSGRRTGCAAVPRGWGPVAPGLLGGQEPAVKPKARGTARRWREVVLPLCRVLLWAPQCKRDMATLERTPRPGPPHGPSHFPLASESRSVGANSHQRQQDGAVLARSSAGRRQALAEQRCPGTGTSTPLPVLAVHAWPASLVSAEGPPVPGSMGQASCCCCGSREALTDAEPVLSADVRLSRGRKRSERRLLLLQEELVVAKLQRGTTLHPQLRLALHQLWVLSGGKEAPGQEEEEEEGSEEDSTSLIFSWPTGSCLATFGSRALKELWLGTLLGTPEGDKRARVTRLPSLKVLQKELSRRHAWRTLSARNLDRLMEGQAEADPKRGPPTVPSGNGGGRCRSPGEFWKERQAPTTA
ncbi:uncharacterized protein LOC142081074 [Calonectris borealis]|uniref:uncharacterized protein LOC142081074 n=1 Tax=Calonectris borealis TaxID=1323832 RepID=UPI003F4C1FAD